VNPDVVTAVGNLERGGTLSREQATLFRRVARRELVSVHTDLRLLAYAGVLLIMSGVGFLVAENLDRIGPLVIVGALAVAALTCFIWVVRHAAAFTWNESASSHLAFDYVLLLGALLVGADLAYIEAKLTALGDAWPYHLLVLAVLYGLLALRYDSRVLLSLCLSTFAAWRGVSAGKLEHAFWMGGNDLIRVNAAGCGILFIVLGALLRRRGQKAHFEPVLVHFGWLLLLGAVTTGLGDSDGVGFALLLVMLAAVLALVGYLQKRFSLLAISVVAAYVGVSALLVRGVRSSEWEIVVLWFAVTPLIVVGALFAVHRYLPEPE
jgi:hypothetical protein